LSHQRFRGELLIGLTVHELASKNPVDELPMRDVARRVERDPLLRSDQVVLGWKL